MRRRVGRGKRRGRVDRGWEEGGRGRGMRRRAGRGMRRRTCRGMRRRACRVMRRKAGRGMLGWRAGRGLRKKEVIL
jgi:hypothetical protein